MKNKNNFMGIIIPVVIAVILLTVLPILTDISKECPSCEEIPSYDIGQISVNPNFSSGNYNVDKGSYDYLDSVTIIKDDNLIPENIKKDVNIFGVIGTLESGGGGYTVTFTDNNFNEYTYTQGGIHYSFDNGVTYHPITTLKSVITDSWEIVPATLMGVTQIRFKIVAKDVYNLCASVGSVLTPSSQSGNWSAESSNITLSSDVTYELEWWED